MNKPKTVEGQGAAESTAPLKDVNVTSPPAIEALRENYFYKYGSELATGLGIYSVNPSTASDGTFPLYSLIDFVYILPSVTSFHIQTGVETISAGEGHIWAAAQWISHSTERWRPFYTAGPGIRLIPANGLATFLAFSHYFIRGSVGAEYGIKDRHSLRGEIFAASDFQLGTFYGLSLGYSYGM